MKKFLSIKSSRRHLIDLILLCLTIFIVNSITKENLNFIGLDLLLQFKLLITVFIPFFFLIQKKFEIHRSDLNYALPLLPLIIISFIHLAPINAFVNFFFLISLSIPIISGYFSKEKCSYLIQNVSYFLLFSQFLALIVNVLLGNGMVLDLTKTDSGQETLITPTLLIFSVIFFISRGKKMELILTIFFILLSGKRSVILATSLLPIIYLIPKIFITKFKTSFGVISNSIMLFLLYLLLNGNLDVFFYKFFGLDSIGAIMAGRFSIYTSLISELEVSSYFDFFFGHGIGSSKFIIGDYIGLSEKMTHNDVLRILFEFGLIGCVIFIISIYSLAKNRNAFSLIISFNIIFFLTNNFFFPVIHLLFFITLKYLNNDQS